MLMERSVEPSHIAVLQPDGRQGGKERNGKREMRRTLEKVASAKDTKVKES